MSKEFKKLSEVTELTVVKVWGYKWKKWDNEQSKMLVSDTYQQGYSKKYSLECTDFNIEVSSHQYASMLEGVSNGGVADVNNKTFSVKTNGKTGMEIRYYINPVKNSSSTNEDKDDSLPF